LGDTASRVDVTPAAGALLTALMARNGPVMFHQSGGCCDGSSPMCYPAGEFITGDSDVLLGELSVHLDDGSTQAVPVWMSKAQFEY